MSEKNKVTALILAVLLGWLGVHRFYVGKIGSGVVQFLTLGGFGVWALMDIVQIARGKFTDEKGVLLSA